MEEVARCIRGTADDLDVPPIGIGDVEQDRQVRAVSVLDDVGDQLADGEDVVADHLDGGPVVAQRIGDELSPGARARRHGLEDVLFSVDGAPVHVTTRVRHRHGIVPNAISWRLDTPVCGRRNLAWNGSFGANWIRFGSFRGINRRTALGVQRGERNNMAADIWTVPPTVESQGSLPGDVGN